MIITIARSYGSGGKEIGRALAKELGIKYYGRELFEASENEDSIYSGDDESMRKFSLGETDELFKRQSELIRNAAEQGDCVIVGRCADFVLRDRTDVIKIYLYAPPRECMRRVIRLYELNPEDAKELIRSMNKTRGDYYLYNTGQEWSDPMHYDICLNTAGLGTERCIEILRCYIKAYFN